MKFTLISCILLFLTFGCGRKGKMVEETDSIGFRTVYKLDKESQQKQGIQKRYDAEGNLVEEANYTNGKLEGLRIIFDENGDTSVVETYTAGKFDGPYRTYHPGGQQQRFTGNYVDNTMTGLWYKYNAAGQMIEEVTFADNLENGPFREWHDNGNLAAEGSYLEGDNEHGRLRIYNENGSLNRVMDCEKGICSSLWRESDGTPLPDSLEMLKE